MALFGTYKPKFETSFTGIAKQHPIASVVSMGAVPAIGALAGNVLETGRAMFSDTGDPMALVKSRTQQVAGDLSDYANGKAGKITAMPPKVQTPGIPTTPGAGNGAAMLPSHGAAISPTRMGPSDLSRMSDGTLPAVTRRSAMPAGSVRKPATIAQPKPAFTATPTVPLAVPDVAPAGERVYEYKDTIDPEGESPVAVSAGMSPEQIKGFNLGKNGGIATMDGRTFVLPERSAGEEATYRTQLAKDQASQPGIATPPAQQMTMVGSSSMEPRLVAPGQAAFGRDYSKMSLGQLWEANRQQKDDVRNSNIANINSEITSRGNKDAIAAIKMPSEIEQNLGSARNANASAAVNLAKAPSEIAGTKSISALHDAQRGEIEYLKEARRQGIIADADYKVQMGKVTGERLALLKQQMAQQAKQAKGSNYDWKSMNASAADAVKLLMEKKSAGGLSPEEEQDLTYWSNAHKESWGRMRKDGYMPQQIQTEG